MKLSAVERAALLRCRYAGRYDNLRAKRFASPSEAAEEQASGRVQVPVTVYFDLERRGLIYRLPPPKSSSLRLTAAGREALAPEEKGTER